MTGPNASMAFPETLRLTGISSLTFAAVFAWLATDPGLASGPAMWLFTLFVVAHLGGGGLRTLIATLRHAVALRGPYRRGKRPKRIGSAYASAVKVVDHR